MGTRKEKNREKGIRNVDKTGTRGRGRGEFGVTLYTVFTSTFTRDGGGPEIP